MSVQELSLLHRRYIDLSDRFKAAWTYHQFVQGIRKVFHEQPPGRDLVSFQSVYASLKGVSQNLNTTATDNLRGQLDGIERELQHRIRTLLQEDSRISPSTLRQFFQRVKNYDEKILTQLLKFYVYTQTGSQWEADRIDKVDFLLTKLGEEIQDLKVTAIVRDPTRLKEIFHSLWAILGQALADEGEVAEQVRAIGEIRQEIDQVTTLDDLNERELVKRYRRLKRDLDHLFFEPRISVAILEGNLKFKQCIQTLYQQEERRFISEYQEVFELQREAAVDNELEGELQVFRQEIEKFEQQLQKESVRLEDLAHVRERVRFLMPRLRDAATGQPSTAAALEGATGGAPPAQAGDTGNMGEMEAIPAVGLTDDGPSLRLRSLHEGVIGEHLHRIIATLETSDWEASARAVTVTPELQPLRLQPREVVAFRRLHANEQCDRELEQFLLEAAALRVRVTEEAEGIIGMLDENPGRDNGQIFEAARITTRLADAFERRFSHFINQTIQDGAFSEAQNLQLLRMRLLRDYSGLWLLAHRGD